MTSRQTGPLRRALTFLSRAWNISGILALLLGIVFLSWRIPTERAEMREFWTRVQLSDGPHVFWLDGGRAKVVNARPDREGRRFHISEETYSSVRPEPLPPEIRPLLSLAPPTPQDNPSELPWPEAPVAALSDIHGQYLHFRDLLARAGITNPSGDWSFGKGHLVILGDVFDKGPGVTDALWLIRRLEVQARSQGGGVHYLLGNHDLLAITGGSKAVHYKYVLIAGETGIPYQHFYSRDSELGRWLRTRNTVLKIGDRLFVHGGLSHEFLKMNLTLTETNRLIQLSLDPDRLALANQPERRLAGLLSGGQGPLWWRGYFDGSIPTGFIRRVNGRLGETTTGREALETALSRYGVRQVVVGHTYTREVREMYGGKLIALCLNWGGADLPESRLPAGLAIFDANGKAKIVNFRD